MCSRQFASAENTQAGAPGGRERAVWGQRRLSQHSRGREPGEGSRPPVPACSHPRATLTRITDPFHCLPICPDARFQKVVCAPRGPCSFLEPLPRCFVTWDP